MGLHVLYIDDGIYASVSEAKSVEDRKIVTSDLEVGFVLNIPKINLEPQYIADHYRFVCW